MPTIETRGRELEVSEDFFDLSPSEQDDFIDSQLGPSRFTDVLRAAVGQGLAFGFGDEVEAFVRSIGNDRTYDELANEIRGDIETFREEAPVLAYGSELLGGALTGGAGLGRTAASTALRSGALGAAYGAGQAEGGAGERLQGAAVGGALGAGLGAAAKKVLPGVSKEARQLQKEGVELTPGMALEGVVGRGVKEFEETLTSVPMLGTGPALGRTKDSFTKSTINKALADINESLPKTISVDDAAATLTNKIGNALDDSVKNLKISDVRRLSSDMESLLRNGLFEAAEIKNIKNALFKTALSKTSNNQLTGQNLQNADRLLRRRIKSFANSPDPLNQEKSDTYRKLYEILENAIKKDNPAQDVAKYTNAKKAYAKEMVIRKASTASSKDASFTPGQLLQASKAADKSASKGMTFTGRGLLQPEGRVAESVIGRNVGDSGTTGRALGALALLGGTSLINPMAAALAVPTLAAYRSPMTQRALLEALGQSRQLGRLAPITAPSLPDTFSM
jgi:hypothetical protein